MALFSKNISQNDSAGHSAMTDEQLIIRYRTISDNRCIEELFDRYTHLVFGVCMKYLSDEDKSKDAVMEIFEDLFDLLKEHNISNFKSWLHTVSRNFCLMLLRKEKSRELYDSELVKKSQEIYVENEGTQHQLEEETTYNKLHSAISRLCDEQKKCIELMYLDDKSYKEIATITGFTMNQVKSFIQNGKRNLKILMMQ